MTNPTMALAELAEKGADVDVLRQMMQFMAQRLRETGSGLNSPRGRLAGAIHRPRDSRPARCSPGRCRNASR